MGTCIDDGFVKTVYGLIDVRLLKFEAILSLRFPSTRDGFRMHCTTFLDASNSLSELEVVVS